MASDGPAIVYHPAIILDDRHEILSAQGANARHVGEACRYHLRIERLVRQSIADAPGERTDTATLKTNPLVEDQCHRVKLLPAARVLAHAHRYPWPHRRQRSRRTPRHRVKLGRSAMAPRHGCHAGRIPAPFRRSWWVRNAPARA